MISRVYAIQTKEIVIDAPESLDMLAQRKQVKGHVNQLNHSHNSSRHVLI